MFDKVAEQFQNSCQPLADLIAVNTNALEQLAQQQTTLVTGVLNDGVAFAEGLSAQKDVTSFVEAQKAYAEGVQEKVTAAAKDAYSVLTETQEKAGEVLKCAFEQAKEVATPAAAPKAAKAAKAAK